MNECLSCDTKSKMGYWQGTLIGKNGKIIPLVGLVETRDDGTFDLDPLIEQVSKLYNIPDDEDIESMTGEALCPNCMSDLYFECDI